MSELKRFDIVGKYADEETMYEFRPDGECYDADACDWPQLTGHCRVIRWCERPEPPEN